MINSNKNIPALLFLVSCLLLFACNDPGDRGSARTTTCREIEITFRNPIDQVSLSGTLTMPVGDGPFPAVVLVTGSGPHGRDLSFGPHRLFFTLADYLGHHGIAVIRYDKRGCGKSDGTYEPYNLDNWIGDALGGVAFLHSHETIDSKRIGALGISQGGLIVPAMAACTSDVRFIVMLAAPGVWGKEFFCLSSIAIARASGFDESAAARIRDLYDKMWPLYTKRALSGSETGEATRLLAEIAGFMDAKTRSLFSLDDIDGYFTFMRSPHLLESLDWDPARVLKQVQCPVLALNGSRDVQVSAKENLAAIEKALREGGNRAHEVAELDAVNHLFQRCRTGLPGEYLTSREAMAPEVLEKIANWILATNDAGDKAQAMHPQADTAGR